MRISSKYLWFMLAFGVSFIAAYTRLPSDTSDYIRPMTDLAVYHRNFISAGGESLMSWLTISNHDSGYALLEWAFAQQFTFRAFLSALYGVIVAAYVFLCLSLTRSAWLALVGVAIFLVIPMSESLSFVVLRQGWSFAFLLLAIHFRINSRIIIAIAMIAIASSMHWTGLVFGGCILLGTMPVREKAAIATSIFLFSLALYVVEVPPAVAHGFFGYTYDVQYQSGFKLSFLVASLACAIAASPLAMMGDVPRRGIFAMALLVLSVHLLSSWMPYYDRFGLFVWALAPALMVTSLSLFWQRFGARLSRGILRPS